MRGDLESPPDGLLCEGDEPLGRPRDGEGAIPIQVVCDAGEDLGG